MGEADINNPMNSGRDLFLQNQPERRSQGSIRELAGIDQKRLVEPESHIRNLRRQSRQGSIALSVRSKMSQVSLPIFQ